jgi:hypothetical protein
MDSEAHKVSPTQRSPNLVSVGVLTAVVYLATPLFYLKGPQSHSRTAKQVFACLSVIALLFLFWKGYQLVSRAHQPESLRMIVGFAAVFALIAFLTFPFHSTDVFGYINRGWQQVHYGQNPYVYSLAQVPNWQQDPMLRDHWIYNPNPYGFLFTLLARLLCWIGNGNWWLTLFLFKGLNILAYAGTAALVWSGAKRLGQKKPTTVLYLFLWNPLILMHCIANGHNDILTGFLIVLAIYLAIVGQWFWIIPTLAAASLLKYAPGLVIPVAFVFVVKNKGWTTAISSCLAAALLVALVSFPFLRDWTLFEFKVRLADIQVNATLIDNSLHSFLIHIFENIARLIPALVPLHNIVDTAIKTTLRVGFLLFLVWQWLKVPKQFTVGTLAKKSLIILFVLFCVVTSKFNAWYMAMILPLALLLDEDYWLRRLVVLISCTELLSLTFFKQAYIVNYFAMVLVPAWIVFRQERKRRNLSPRAIKIERPLSPNPG